MSRRGNAAGQRAYFLIFKKPLQIIEKTSPVEKGTKGISTVGRKVKWKRPSHTWAMPDLTHRSKARCHCCGCGTRQSHIAGGNVACVTSMESRLASCNSGEVHILLSSDSISGNSGIFLIVRIKK